MEYVRYDAVKEGDELLVSSPDNSKTKVTVKVTKVEHYPNSLDDIVYRVTLSTGDVYYGWGYKQLEMHNSP